jgi:hypothetical protein
MGWGLGPDVADDEHLVILVKDVALDFTSDNPAEDTIFVHLTP